MSDPYLNPDNLNAKVIDAISSRLEERAAHPKFQALYQPYFDVVIHANPASILEIGCGTGPVIKNLELQLNKSAHHTNIEIHACDISQSFLKQAKQSTHPKSKIQWQLSKIGEPLPYHQKFDCIIMHTLLGHLSNPSAMLKQAKQLLNPDGQIIIFDTDFLSATFAYDDTEQGRIIDYKLMTGIAKNPDICRKVPQYIKQVGLKITNNYSLTLSEVGQGDFWLSSIHGLAKLITALHILEEKEAQNWLDYQLQAHEQGHFFASTNYYTFILNHKAKGLN